MTNNSTPYLASKLQAEGYTGSTGNTPYKPANAEQLAQLQYTHNNSPIVCTPRTVSASSTVINVNFDATQNNKNFPSAGNVATNLGKLTDLQITANGAANTIYMPGIGAQTVPTAAVDSLGNPAPGSSPNAWDSLPSNAGKIGMEKLNDAYYMLGVRTQAIRANNPDADISINLSGFSRGGAEAVAFVNMLNERGLPGVFSAGAAVVGCMVLFDPVSQTDNQLNTSWPSGVICNSIVFVATDEHRAIMPAMPLGGDANIVPVPGAHSDVGGGYNAQGISAVTLRVARDFQANSGVPIAEIPANLQPDWNQMQVHNPAIDNYGNVIWSGFPFDRQYESADTHIPHDSPTGAPNITDAAGQTMRHFRNAAQEIPLWACEASRWRALAPRHINLRRWWQLINFNGKKRSE